MLLASASGIKRSCGQSTATSPHKQQQFVAVVAMDADPRAPACAVASALVGPSKKTSGQHRTALRLSTATPMQRQHQKAMRDPSCAFQTHACTPCHCAERKQSCTPQAAMQAPKSQPLPENARPSKPISTQTAMPSAGQMPMLVASQMPMCASHCTAGAACTMVSDSSNVMQTMSRVAHRGDAYRDAFARGAALLSAGLSAAERLQDATKSSFQVSSTWYARTQGMVTRICMHHNTTRWTQVVCMG
jgi:hypothetical protein